MRVLLAVSFLFLFACKTKRPESVLPVPSASQVEWQKMETYAFVHFNINTFTDMEWGLGGESPKLFNPTELDCEQWAKTCKDSGLKGIIITAKHHDGFCLWPSKYTEHSVKNSPWKNGNGDVIKELAAACKKYDLKMGIYYSPWDRNHKDYGKPEYINYMKNQLTELLTEYGDVFEVWFDGANGGSGYYGGANEERKVDKLSYYPWPELNALVKKLQPNALIFSDAGPDIRWVGNESGYGFKTNWSSFMRDSVYGGMPEYPKLYAAGAENGPYWVPAETDVSIRPGWYYHTYEDHKVKDLKTLTEIYYESIGRNTTLLLNFPVNRKGLIAEEDKANIISLHKKISKDLSVNIAKDQEFSISSNFDSGFSGSSLTDKNLDTYWAASEIKSDLSVDFKEKKTINAVLLQENITLGQRVKQFTIHAKINDAWSKVASETTIGYKRIVFFDKIEAQGIKISFEDARAAPVISELGIYNIAPVLSKPVITRDSSGSLLISCGNPELTSFYTVDSTKASISSKKYIEPLEIQWPIAINAVCYDATSKESSASTLSYFGAPVDFYLVKEKYKKAFDDNSQTYSIIPESLSIKLKNQLTVKGFTYMPIQARYPSGFVSNYQLMGSLDNKTWFKLSEGEFSNINNSPLEQQVFFKAKAVKFIKFISTKTTDDKPPTMAGFKLISES